MSTEPTIPPIDPANAAAALASATTPSIITPLPGPKAAAWLARDHRVLSPSYTRFYPLVVARGYGCTIEDVDGNRFLDFTAGIAVNSTGHCHPTVTAAIVEQAHKLLHMSGTDFYYTPEIELAERLARVAPGATRKRVFFTNSGTEAIEAALKLARYHTGRPLVVAFQGGFHGRTYGGMSLSASKAVHRAGFGPLVPGVHHLPFNCGRKEFDRLFSSIAAPEEIAAIFVEPIQGEGGYRVATPGFLPMLREICDHHGILLVFDEIQSGLGRTGRMFACQHYGPMAMPDILCIAKGIASGLPLGAMIARADLMDWPSGSHASTFGGNPVCCAAALATLDLIERDYCSSAAARGLQLRAGLDQLNAAAPWLTAVRGYGLMQAMDVHRGNTPDPNRRDLLLRAAFRAGLLLLPCGHAGVRFCPPLSISPEEIETGLRILRTVTGADERD